MASPSGSRSAAESQHLFDARSRGSLSEGSTIAASYADAEAFDGDDEEADESGKERSPAPPPSFFSRLLQAMSLRRRKPSEHDYFSTPRDELPDGLLKKRRFRHASPREVRRCRRSYVAGCVKKTLLSLPVLILVAL